MSTLDLSPIDVTAELNLIGSTVESINEHSVRCLCPFHDDHTPSCTVDLADQVFYCPVCTKGGDVVTLLAGLTKCTRRAMIEDLSQRYDLAISKTIRIQTVEKYHDAIWNEDGLLSELYKRGATDELIRKHRLGMRWNRITIPIFNEAGLCVNMRQYQPGAKRRKMINVKGYGSVNRLYPIDQLKYKKIVVCGGELKALVAGAMLNEHGFGCLCTTGGEHSWEPEFSERLAEKTIYVCLDIDAAGVTAAEKLCARLKGFAEWVGNVELPLDRERYPKGDVNDWIGIEGAQSEDFLALLSRTSEWEPAHSDSQEPGEPLTLHLSKASRPEHTGQRIKVTAIVGMLDLDPYIIPKDVKATCSRNDDDCNECPVYAIKRDQDGAALIAIPNESSAILEMVAVPKKAQREAIITGLGIPRRCKSVAFEPTSYYRIEDVRLNPQLEISSRTADNVTQSALCIGDGLEANEGYEFTGVMHPHPKTQQATMLCSKAEPVQDALSSYSPSDEQIERLAIFRPVEWTVGGLQAKLDTLYEDFSANVTTIYKRQDLHFSIDLAYHSALLFDFDKRTVKGWSEILIMGDSSQGKTDTAMRLQEHYGLGTKVDCKNATVAGILGGVLKTGDRWMVSWGILPANDKRLVVLEELKGAGTEVIAAITEARSSGIAEIPKIERRKTHCRTRLIALSNPRSGQPMASYAFGIEAITELVGGLEDVRRFDAVLLVSANEIPAAELNRLLAHRPVVPHVHTSELCRQCVLWAWTRQSDQIVFDEEARDSIFSEAIGMCSMFTEAIPLVDRGSMRFKLARLAISLACRTFSTDDGKTVLVRRCHVQYISQWLTRVYSSPIFGYLEFSAATQMTESLESPGAVLDKFTPERPGVLPNPKQFIQHILACKEIELRDLQDWCGWDREQGLELLSFFVNTNALIRVGRAYRKTPPFIELLKKARLGVLSRPDYLPETRTERF